MMQLSNVQNKKYWTYIYDSEEEMNFHIRSMKGFTLELKDVSNLKAIFSQTINSQNRSDIEYKREDSKKEIKALLV